MNRLLVVAFLVAAVHPPAGLQAQAAQPPKPGTAVQRLAYYVGSWQTEGETTAGPLRSAFTFSETGTCEWFAGGFQLVCRHEGTRPASAVTDLSIVAYDTEARHYTYFTITSLGDTARSTGSVKGDTWTYVWDGTVDGKPAKFRYIEVHESPISYTFKTERSIGGGPWRLLESGKATKLR